MQEIISHSTNPYFNAALEYFLIHNIEEECLLIYRNESSVIIGKHQNAFAEANLQYLTANKIPLIRRITGGGAVYHDLGNINICTVTKGKINFKNFLNPLIQALTKLNLSVTATANNDLRINDEKITGTAAHIFNDITIHHGTLLFDASLEQMQKTLAGRKSCFIDKSVKSKTSATTNIKNHLRSDVGIDEFTDVLKEELYKHYQITKQYELTEDEKTNIQNLVSDKFSRWEWNYGFSPDFVFTNTLTNPLEVNIDLEVKVGLIQHAHLRLAGKNKPYPENLLYLPFITDKLANTLHTFFLSEFPQLNMQFWHELLTY